MMTLLMAGPLARGQVGALLKQADAEFRKRGGGSKWVKKAIETYKMALAIEPSTAEAYWKIARCHYNLGIRLKGRRALAVFREGIAYAKLAVHYAPKCIEAHYWLGISYGKYGQISGAFQSLALVDHVRKAMRKVLRLSPDFDRGGAYRILGRMEYILNSKISGLKGSSNARALKWLGKSVKLGPNYLITRLFIADAYLKADDRPAALKHLRYAANFNCQREKRYRMIPECRLWRKKARRKIAELQ